MTANGSGHDVLPAGDSERGIRLLRSALWISLFVVGLWLVGKMLLVVFAGVLLATLLDGLAKFVSHSTRMSRTPALALVTTLLAVTLVGGLFLLAPRAAGHAYELFNNISMALDHLSRTLSKFFPNITIPAGQFPTASALVAQLAGVTSTFTNVIFDAAIIVFVGFYGALRPSVYINGLIRLFPLHERDQVKDILRESGRTLQWWLLGRAVSMVAVGTLTLIGLRLLNIPSFLTLSVFAALMTFIPYIGAVISAVPAVLVGFVLGPATALYVMIVFTGAHILDAYLLSPFVQQRTIHMPPALLLAAQGIFGTLFGMAGMTLAAPITATGMVVIRMYYLRDVLGEPPVEAAREQADQDSSDSGKRR